MYVAFILPLVSVFSARFCSKFCVLLIVTLINAAATSSYERRCFKKTSELEERE
jgi:hypothetical protein